MVCRDTAPCLLPLPPCLLLLLTLSAGAFFNTRLMWLVARQVVVVLQGTVAHMVLGLLPVG